MDSQKHEAQHSILELRQAADQQVSELEQQVIDLKRDLARERATLSMLRDGGHQSLEQLRTENSQLRDNLSKVLGSDALICEATNCEECCYNEMYWQHHFNF